MDKWRFVVRKFRKKMTPKPKKIDRRSKRTRHALSSALVELVKEKRFDKITIQNVIDRADVGRSTFYTHFRDKDDLFQKDWERFLDLLADNIDWPKAGAAQFVPVTFLFRHLEEFQTFYQSLVRSGMADSIFKSGVEYLANRITMGLNARIKHKSNATIPVPVLSNYLASELFSLLKWWLDNRMPYPPERMDQMYHDLVNPTIKSALG
jgi:AcrR family transcriptional regulator